MHTTKITRTLALAGFAPAGKLSHLYSGFVPVLALSVATLGKLNWGKKAYAVLLLCAATTIALPAQTYTTLFSFDGTDGANPSAGLVQATNGDFYGTTESGGANGGGTVFKITLSGMLTTLYSFCSSVVYPSCPNGSLPYAGLIQATNGDFYGTTASGGAAGACATNSYGCGTVFKITPSGTLTTLHSFAGYPTDGAQPDATLLQATNGDLYGTTEFGGANDCSSGAGCGTVFKITPSGTLTTLYSFCAQSGCTDGAYPFQELVQATNGDFYGTTDDGAGAGTVFKITSSGTLTTLYTFCPDLKLCINGANPQQGGLIQALNGDLYGTTAYGAARGGGTVFQITPSGTLTTLHGFCDIVVCTGGNLPWGSLVQATDGNFYATTTEGAAYPGPFGTGPGTIFTITPSGTFTTLYSFCAQSGCTDGSAPKAGLVQATNGTLYGTASAGGIGNAGTVFSLSVGLGPFVKTQTTSGAVGAAVKILGSDLTGATSVSFNGTAAVFNVSGSSLIKTLVPAGATTGTVQVVTPSGTLSSNVPFRVLP